MNKFHSHCLPAPQITHDVISGLDVGTATVTRKPAADTMWIALPYHPLSAAAITSELRKLSQDPDNKARYKAVFGKDMPQLRAAWTNSDTHLEMRLRNSTRKRKEASNPRKEEGDSRQLEEQQFVEPLVEEAPVVVAINADNTGHSHGLQFSVPSSGPIRHRKRVRDFVYPPSS